MLRERTHAVHRRVEATLDLANPGTDAARLQAVLVRFHAFWSAIEPAIERWAGEETAVAGALDWPRRRRSLLLARDVTSLAAMVGPVPAAPAPLEVPFAIAGTAEVLGWLYVSEGSTLGGAVITRMLERNPATAGIALASFAPYAEGPQPMWRDYQGVLDAWTGVDQLRAERVSAAALHAFTTLERYLAPLDRMAAA